MPASMPSGCARVPMVVESPDHQIVLRNEQALGGQYRIVVFLGQLLGFVQMIEESRFVSDDQIVAGGSGALKHVESGHHGHGNSGYRSVGVASFEGVHGVALPGNTHLLLNAGNHFASGKALGFI